MKLLPLMLLSGLGVPAHQGPPTFPVEARAVTVDVVALDRGGVPVPDLTAAEFTVFEDDQPQEVIAFERRVLRRPAIVGAKASAGDSIMEPVVSALTLIIDDLSLSPTRDTLAVKEAILRFIRSDRWPGPITIATTSGDVWWSGVGVQGREDLLSVTGRIKGKRPPESFFRLGGGGVMTEWQAYRIANDLLHAEGESRALAMQVNDWWRRRAHAVLGAVRAVAEGSSLWRGRKPIVILTRGFIQDNTLEAVDPTLTTSQDANAAIYFVDAEGLAGDSRYSLEFSGPPGASAGGTIDQDFLRTAGAEYLAGATGGFAANTNDPGEALERVGRESSSYYLLGYEPKKAMEGSRHRLRVVVRRPGVTVRFRRSYETTATTVRAVPTRRSDDASAADPVLLTGVDHDQVSIQLATSLQGVSGARLLAIIDVDISKISFNSAVGGGESAILDLALFGAMRDGPERFRSREHLTLATKAAGHDILTLTRPVELSSGVAQLRVLVREPGTGRAGTAAVRLEVPSPDKPYIATLMALDLGSTEEAMSARKARPVARRQFAPRGRLLLQYQVQGLVKGDVPARLLGSFVLRRMGGQLVSKGDPTPFPAEGGSLPARVLAIPLEDLEDGSYEILIKADNMDSGESVEAGESFVVSRGRLSALHFDGTPRMMLGRGRGSSVPPSPPTTTQVEPTQKTPLVATGRAEGPIPSARREVGSPLRPTSTTYWHC